MSHGHPLYSIWANMKNRCLNPKAVRYADYGGRGITVCERWLSFKNFAEDLGERPEGMTLDRVNNNKGYMLSNVKWSTKAQQNSNSRRCVMVTFNGKTQPINSWCREIGLSYVTYKFRRRRGWSVVKAATTPPDIRRRKKVVRDD